MCDSHQCIFLGTYYVPDYSELSPGNVVVTQQAQSWAQCLWGDRHEANTGMENHSRQEKGGQLSLGPGTSPELSSEGEREEWLSKQRPRGRREWEGRKAVGLGREESVVKQDRMSPREAWAP
jgi:hypothetical protein